MQQEGVQGGASVQVVRYDAMLQMVHDLPEQTNTVTAEETQDDVVAFKLQTSGLAAQIMASGATGEYMC
eukprot:1583043-Pyramimonas_sp.AAC.1